MPLRDELLNPIPGANPAGENLRYAQVYDKIKEARRQDDDTPQGDWQRERKLADWPATIKLIVEALSKKSKDLQLAAWLTEALLRRDGMAGLDEGLDVLQSLIETFWENLYPEIDDGDAEFRAAPLQWVGDKLDIAVKNAPLTRAGLDFYQYKESRAVGYEHEAAESETKAAARQAAIDEGKVTAEDFDQAFDATPKAWYAQLEQTCDRVLDRIGTLSDLCDGKFGDVSPSFSRLRTATEEVRQSVHILLQKKREKEPDIVETAAPQAEIEPEPAGGGTAVVAVRAPARRTAGEPADREDAVGLVVAAARFIRRAEPHSPAPYLMLRGLRWGELRGGGKTIDQTLLDAPPTEIRQQLKRLALQGSWEVLLEGAESAMGMPYGRGWLDIQRYVCRACAELGRPYAPIAQAVQSELQILLHDLPELPQLTLLDDTATASPDTLKWLRDLGTVDLPEPAPMAYTPAPRSSEDDVFDMATRAVAAGRPQEGIEMLSRELARERSGRGRFQRKMQMAELCLTVDRVPIALPLLQDLAAEIDQRKLEEWESPDSIARALSLLFRCLEKLDGSYEDKQRLYERICRLDPAQAMSCVL